MCWFFIVIKLLMLKLLLASISGLTSVVAYEYGYHPSAEEFDNLLRDTHRTWTRDILYKQAERELYQKRPTTEVRSFVPKFQYESHHLNKFNNGESKPYPNRHDGAVSASSSSSHNRVTLQNLGSTLDFHYTNEGEKVEEQEQQQQEENMPTVSTFYHKPKETKVQLTTTGHTFPELNLKPISQPEMEKYSLNNLYKNNTQAHFPIYFTNPATGIVYAITEMGKSSTSVARSNGSIPIFITKEQYERDIMFLKQEYESQCAPGGDTNKDKHKKKITSSFSRPLVTTTTTTTTMRPQIIRLHKPGISSTSISKLVKPLKKPQPVIVKTQLTVKDKKKQGTATAATTTARPLKRKRKPKNKKKATKPKPPGHKNSTTTPRPNGAAGGDGGPNIVMGTRTTTRRPYSDAYRLSTQLEKPSYGTNIFSMSPIEATPSNVGMNHYLHFNKFERKRRSLEGNEKEKRNTFSNSEGEIPEEWGENEENKEKLNKNNEGQTTTKSSENVNKSKVKFQEKPNKERNYGPGIPNKLSESDFNNEKLKRKAKDQKQFNYDYDFDNQNELSGSDLKNENFNKNSQIKINAKDQKQFNYDYDLAINYDSENPNKLSGNDFKNEKFHKKYQQKRKADYDLAINYDSENPNKLSDSDLKNGNHQLKRNAEDRKQFNYDYEFEKPYKLSENNFNNENFNKNYQIKRKAEDQKHFNYDYDLKINYDSESANKVIENDISNENHQFKRKAENQKHFNDDYDLTINYDSENPNKLSEHDFSNENVNKNVQFKRKAENLKQYDYDLPINYVSENPNKLIENDFKNENFNKKYQQKRKAKDQKQFNYDYDLTINYDSENPNKLSENNFNNENFNKNYQLKRKAEKQKHFNHDYDIAIDYDSENPNKLSGSGSKNEKLNKNDQLIRKAENQKQFNHDYGSENPNKLSENNFNNENFNNNDEIKRKVEDQKQLNRDNQYKADKNQRNFQNLQTKVEILNTLKNNYLQIDNLNKTEKVQLKSKEDNETIFKKSSKNLRNIENFNKQNAVNTENNINHNMPTNNFENFNKNVIENQRNIENINDIKTENNINHNMATNNFEKLNKKVTENQRNIEIFNKQNHIKTEDSINHNMANTNFENLNKNAKENILDNKSIKSMDNNNNEKVNLNSIQNKNKHSSKVENTQRNSGQSSWKSTENWINEISQEKLNEIEFHSGNLGKNKYLKNEDKQQRNLLKTKENLDNFPNVRNPSTKQETNIDENLYQTENLLMDTNINPSENYPRSLKSHITTTKLLENIEKFINLEENPYEKENLVMENYINPSANSFKSQIANSKLLENIENPYENIYLEHKNYIKSKNRGNVKGNIEKVVIENYIKHNDNYPGLRTQIKTSKLETNLERPYQEVSVKPQSYNTNYFKSTANSLKFENEQNFNIIRQKHETNIANPNESETMENKHKDTMKRITDIETKSNSKKQNLTHNLEMDYEKSKEHFLKSGIIPKPFNTKENIESIANSYNSGNLLNKIKTKSDFINDLLKLRDYQIFTNIKTDFSEPETIIENPSTKDDVKQENQNKLKVNKNTENLKKSQNIKVTKDRKFENIYLDNGNLVKNEYKKSSLINDLENKNGKENLWKSTRGIPISPDVQSSPEEYENRNENENLNTTKTELDKLILKLSQHLLKYGEDEKQSSGVQSIYEGYSHQLNSKTELPKLILKLTKHLLKSGEGEKQNLVIPNIFQKQRTAVSRQNEIENLDKPKFRQSKKLREQLLKSGEDVEENPSIFDNQKTGFQTTNELYENLDKNENLLNKKFKKAKRIKQLLKLTENLLKVEGNGKQKSYSNRHEQTELIKNFVKLTKNYLKSEYELNQQSTDQSFQLNIEKEIGNLLKSSPNGIVDNTKIQISSNNHLRNKRSLQYSVDKFNQKIAKSTKKLIEVKNEENVVTQKGWDEMDLYIENLLKNNDRKVFSPKDEEFVQATKKLIKTTTTENNNILNSDSNHKSPQTKREMKKKHITKEKLSEFSTKSLENWKSAREIKIKTTKQIENIQNWLNKIESNTKLHNLEEEDLLEREIEYLKPVTLNENPHRLHKRSADSHKHDAILPKFVKKSNNSSSNSTNSNQKLSNSEETKTNLTNSNNRSSANSKITDFGKTSQQKSSGLKKRTRNRKKIQKTHRRKNVKPTSSILQTSSSNSTIETTTSRTIKNKLSHAKDHKRAKVSQEDNEGEYDFFDVGAEAEEEDEDEEDDDSEEEDDDDYEDEDSAEDDLEEKPIRENSSSAEEGADFGALEEDQAQYDEGEATTTPRPSPPSYAKDSQNPKDSTEDSKDKKRTRRRPTPKIKAKDDYDDDDDEDEEDSAMGSNLGGFFRMIFYPVQMMLSGIMDTFGGGKDNDDETSSSSSYPYPQYTSYHNTLKQHSSDDYSYDEDGDDYDNDSSDSSLTGWFSSLFGLNRRNKKIGSTTVSPTAAAAASQWPTNPTNWFQSWFGFGHGDDGVDKSDTLAYEDENEYDKWFASWFGDIKPKARKRTTTTTSTTTQLPHVPILTIVDPMRNPQNWIGILAHHIINHTSTTTQNPLKDIWARITTPATTTTTTTTENPDIPRKISYNKYQIWRLKPQDDAQVQALEEYKKGDDGIKLQWLKGPSLRGLTDVLVPPRMLVDFQASLSFESIDHEVLIFDVGKAIAYEKSKEDYSFTTTQNPKKRQNNNRQPNKPQAMTWMRYYEFEDIVTYLENMRMRYPQLVELIHIGRSYEGRPLIVMKIESKEAAATNSANLQMHEKSKLRNKKRIGLANAVFIEAGTHGAEWIGPATATWIINELLKTMKNNKTISDEQSLIRNTTWYVMPVLNPDGYVYSHEYDRFWKKSRSRHISRPSGLIDSAMTWLQKKKTKDRVCYGVDLDRNWNYQWGKRGSSRTPCSEVYAGPVPFSEPETKVLSEFLMDYRTHIKLYISMQAYGQIISYPYKANTTYDAERLDDFLDVAMVGTDGLRKKGSKSRYKIDSTNDLVEHRSGSADAFAAYDVGIPFSYTMQLADNGVHGYLLPSAAIDSTSRDAFEIIIGMLDYI